MITEIKAACTEVRLAVGTCFNEEQLATFGKDAGDILVVFSGSGNSANVVNALEMGNKLGMETFAVLGYSGGKCKGIAKHPIHFAIDDMQIAEDLQLIIFHMAMQWLCEQGPAK